MNSLFTYFLILYTFLFGAGFLFPFLFRKNNWSWRLSLWMAVFANFLGAVMGGGVVLQLLPAPPKPFCLTLNWWSGITGVPPLYWKFHMDTLAAFFCGLIAFFALLVALYSFEALKASHYHHYQARITSAFNLFAGSTVLTVLAYDIFSLIIWLEVATLAFGYLTLYKHTFFQDERPRTTSKWEKKREAYLAPQVYAMISHTGTAFLTAAVIILAIWAGGIDYTALIKNHSALNSTVATVIFFLALTGLGIRAGFVPFHFWVALVHPTSPTPPHAFSLGVAIKVAIYLMVRFFFQFLTPVPWWGYVVLIMAALTALINVWYAMASHDLKTALAYHSIENMGIIGIGLGIALITYRDHQAIAILAMIACLYHLLNHAVFKGLLYLATGAIEKLTHGVVEFHKLGGLIKLYPITASFFLVGSYAIAGFPPFNGFISEWLTLCSIFGVFSNFKWPYILGIVLVLVSLVMLVMAFALTIFCFYKIMGMTLLGLTRTPQEEQQEQQWATKDVSWQMSGVMAILALACLLLGIFPKSVIIALEYVLQPLFSSPFAVSALPWHLPQTLLVLGSILVVGIIAFSLKFLLLRTKQKPAHSWNCGTPDSVLPVNRITSVGVSFLLQDMLRGFFYKEQEVDAKKEILFSEITLSNSPHYHQRVVEVFRFRLNVVTSWLLAWSNHIGKTLQNRDIRRYLRYIFIANLLVLFLFILFGK